MHTPMRFTFSKEAVDERAIMSKGAEPVHHRMVLDTAAKQIVALDVDFADASGKVFKSTYFEFDLQRARTATSRPASTTVALAGADGDVGSAQKLVLKGDNPPVYRGAMDFSCDAKSDARRRAPKIEAVSSGLDGGVARGGSERHARRRGSRPRPTWPPSADQRRTWCPRAPSTRRSKKKR